MSKFVFLFLALFLNNHLASAETKSARAPASVAGLAEDGENVSEFYKTTRLECIRDGIEKATGIIPSQRYLAAIALKVRSEVAVTMNARKDQYVRQSLSQFGEEDNANERFVYLSNVARYVSTYGVCPYDDSGKHGVRSFIEGEDKKVMDIIESNINSQSQNDRASKMIVDQDSNFLFFKRLFTNEVDGKQMVYTRIPFETRKELAKEAVHVAGKNVNNDNSFENCITEMKRYIKKDGVERNDKIVASNVDLCKSMMKSCGYEKNDAKACSDSDVGTVTAPHRATVEMPRTAPPGKSTPR